MGTTATILLILCVVLAVALAVAIRRCLALAARIKPATAVVEKPAPAPPAVPVPAPRQDALSLLAVLQREARLLDFLKEPVDGYTDAQIGAAVRGVHKDSAAVIERLFGLVALDQRAEGTSVEVASGYDPAHYRLVGRVPAQGPFRGRLTHPGWKATRCEIPEWTGRAEAAKILAPVEIEC